MNEDKQIEARDSDIQGPDKFKVQATVRLI